MHETETITPSESGPILIRETLVGEVRLGEDLTLRQMAVLLIVYLSNEPQTVRGLARHMRVNKPAITRALDLLGQHDLVRRKWDPMDRRSVITQRTLKGAAMVKRLKTRMVAAAAAAAAAAATAAVAEADLRKAS